MQNSRTTSHKGKRPRSDVQQPEEALYPVNGKEPTDPAVPKTGAVRDKVGAGNEEARGAAGAKAPDRKAPRFRFCFACCRT
jgi:hypothetical protein